MPIYGGSTGAIIFAKSIISCAYLDENKIELSDFTALDLVHGYEIWCHYSPDADGDTKRYIKEFNFKKIICVPENARLYVTADDIETVGPGHVAVFNLFIKKVLEPGSRVN